MLATKINGVCALGTQIWPCEKNQIKLIVNAY